MKYEKSCGIVVYRQYEDTIEFLTVRSKAFGHWGFPKGHVEEGESEQETAKREVLEETGLDIEICSNFRRSITYITSGGTSKEVVLFIGQCLEGDVVIQEEEVEDYKWLSYNKALELLTFDSDKKVLTEANGIILLGQITRGNV